MYLCAHNATNATNKQIIGQGIDLILLFYKMAVSSVVLWLVVIQNEQQRDQIFTFCLRSPLDLLSRDASRDRIANLTSQKNEHFLQADSIHTSFNTMSKPEAHAQS